MTKPSGERVRLRIKWSGFEPTRGHFAVFSGVKNKKELTFAIRISILQPVV